jgi:uncharacterized protein (TIGR00255 family)
MSALPKLALKSMTGFAQARVEQDGWALRISVRSVNHRFLDLHLRLPEGFEPFEPRIRQAVRDAVRRGHVDVTLHLEAASPSAVQVNRAVAAAYLKAAEELRREFSLSAEPDLAAILRLPGVIAGDALPAGADAEMFAASVDACLCEALARLEEMRRAEGAALAEEMGARLGTIFRYAAQIEELVARVRPAYMQRLEKRLRELLGEVPLDANRVAQEAAILAERGDISEEIARLRSHVQQFEKLLAGGGEAGKKFDFLLQEMQREANTLLSKTPGVEAEALQITELALEVKSQVEKLREQVQNIE